ncbi:MAG: SRPBCC family protein [Acidimicrobiales bacterium]
MREITVARTLNARCVAVWAVLADYAGIERWNRSVKESHTTNGLETGLGAQRYCKMAPAGSLTETITAWKPEELMVVTIDSTSMIPIGKGVVDYSLKPAGDDQSTAMEIRYAFDVKGGRVAQIAAPLVGKQLIKAFEDVLTDLEEAARSDRR